MKNFLMIFIFCFISYFAYGAEKKSGWAQGFLSCGTFLSECEQDINNNVNCYSQAVFAMGFISGASVVAKIPIEPFNDENSIKYALIKYCKENPLKTTVYGAISILDNLRN